MSNNGNKSDADSTVLERLCRIKKYLKEISKESLSCSKDDSFETFIEISKDYNSLLPPVSDKSLFVVDDILYRDYPTTVTLSRNISENIKRQMMKPETLYTYLSIHLFCEVIEYQHRIILDTTILKMVEHLKPRVFCRIYGYHFITTYLRARLIETSYESVCFALKILNVAFMQNKYFATSAMWRNFKENCLQKALFIKKLISIPHCNSLKMRIITLWIASQAAALVGKMDLVYSNLELKDNINETNNYLLFYLTQTKMLLDGAYIKMLMKSVSYQRRNYKYCNRSVTQEAMTFHWEHLHAYLMSAEDANQRHSLLDNLFTSLDDTSLESKEIRLKNICEVLVAEFHNFLDYLCLGDKVSDELLNYVDEHHDYIFGQYLPDDSFKSTYAAVEKVKYRIRSDKDIESLGSYIKHILYDVFMKSLEVLNIVYSAYLYFLKIYKVWNSDEDEDLYTELFRKPCNNIIKELIHDEICDPSKMYCMPWVIKKTQEKCPFMVLSKRHEFLMGGLVKLLNGEEIDEVAKERLFIVMKNFVQD